MPSSASTFATVPAARRCCASKREQEFRQAPVGTDAGKNLLVLHLSGHDGASYAFAAESFDELRKLSQRKPVHGRAAGFDLRKRFLFDRGDDNLVALRAGSIEHQKREASVACDDAELLF